MAKLAKSTEGDSVKTVKPTGEEYEEHFIYDDATSDGSSTHSANEEQSAALCEYCGEPAHQEGSCPHRDSEGDASERDSE